MWKIVCLTKSNLDETELKKVSIIVETFESIGPTLKYLGAVIDEEHYVKIYFVGGNLK